MEPSPEILKSIVDNILIVNAALDELLKKPTFTGELILSSHPISIYLIL